MKPGEEHIVNYSVYVTLWCALLVLTGITVWVARLHLGAASILAALAIASVKGGLVMYIFMHLRYESRLFKGLFLVALATLATIIGLTFLDVLYR